MTRIVLVGAGSVEFTRNLLGDILPYPALRHAEIVLHDIDPTGSDGRADGGRTADALGAAPVSGHLDRARPRGRRLRHQHDPGRRGAGDAGRLRHPRPLRARSTRSTTRSMRRGPPRPALDPGHPRHCGRHRRRAPDAMLLNYTNPMAHARPRGRRGLGIPVVGLCHFVYWTVDRLANYVGPRGEVDALSAGSTTSPGSSGCSIVAGTCTRISRHSSRRSVPDDDLVRADLYRRFRYYPTESSEHHAEYNPWFIPKGHVEPFPIPIGEYLSRVANNLAEYDDDEAPARRRRGVRDRAQRRVPAVIIHAMATGLPGADRGQRDEPRSGGGTRLLISNPHQTRASRCQPRRRAGRAPTRSAPAAAVRGVHAAGGRLPGADGWRRTRGGSRPRVPRRPHRSHGRGAKRSTRPGG